MTIGQLDRHLARATAARARRGLEAGEAYDRGTRAAAGRTRPASASSPSAPQGPRASLRGDARAGLCPVEAWDQLAGAEGGRRVDFYFGEQFESPDAPRAYWAQHFSGHFARNASVGALPGLMGIFGSKRSYATFYWACRAAPPRWRRLCPAPWVRSVNLNGDEQLLKRHPRAFRRHALDRRQIERFDQVYRTLRAYRDQGLFPLAWIVKPQENTYLARGMHLALVTERDVDSEDAFAAWVESHYVDRICKGLGHGQGNVKCKKRRMTFQRYVSDTALLHGRKFDVRLWLLIASLDPLRVYVLRHGYPKVAAHQYRGVLHPRALRDQCMHIRLMLDPVCNASIRDFLAPFPDGYPKSTASPVFFQGLGLAEGRKFRRVPRRGAAAEDQEDGWVDAESFWHARVWPSVEDALVSVTMLGRASFLRAGADAAARLGGDRATNKDYRRFARVGAEIERLTALRPGARL